MRKTKTLYGLFLLTVVCAATLVLFTGRAYARYNTAAGWNTVIGDTQSSQIRCAGEPILSTKQKTLVFSPPSGAEVQTYHVERMASDGTYVAYTDLDVRQTDGAITVAIGQQTPPAGTYRLHITWSTDGTQTTASATFFINYSDDRVQEVAE